MKLPVVAVFDKKMALYERPFTCRMTAEAIREWDMIRKDTSTKIGKNPEDFDLFQIGTYDDEQGTLESVIPKVHLATGV